MPCVFVAAIENLNALETLGSYWNLKLREIRRRNKLVDDKIRTCAILSCVGINGLQLPFYLFWLWKGFRVCLGIVFSKTIFEKSF